MLVCVSVSGAVHQGVMTEMMMCMRVNAGLCQRQWCCASGCDDRDDDVYESECWSVSASVVLCIRV